MYCHNSVGSSQHSIIRGTQFGDECSQGKSAPCNLVQTLRGIGNSNASRCGIHEVSIQSADKIKAFLRKVIAAQSYGKMLTNGSHFKALGQQCLPFVRKAPFSVLSHFDAISKHYLQAISKKTRNLTEQESSVIQRIVNTNVILRHQTNANLVNDGKLTIFSNARLEKENFKPIEHTCILDRHCLSNHDFVFFAMEFSNDKCHAPLNVRHNSIDYGGNAYLVDDVFTHGYMTLTDHQDNEMVNFGVFEHGDFTKKFPGAIKKIDRFVHGDKGRIDVPMFNYNDMKLALGLHLINFIRHSGDNGFQHYVLSNNFSDKELHQLIHFVFQPEFHVPRIVSTTRYRYFKLREIHFREAVDAGNLERIHEIIQSKDQAYAAINLAVALRRNEVIRELFKAWRFTDSEVSAIKNFFMEYEVHYHLSLYQNDFDIIQFFLEKGLIDVNRPFNVFANDRTMLDNAIKMNNTVMIKLLTSHGGMTMKALKEKQTFKTH